MFFQSLLLFLILCSTEILSAVVFVCENASDNISCPSSQTIHVDYVLFGRDSTVHCPKTRYDQNTNCSANNAIEVVRQKCEGEQNCTVNASIKVFGDPCNGVFKFLQVNYTCVVTKVCAENEEYGCDNPCFRHCQHTRFCTNETCNNRCMCKEGYKRDSATGRCIDEKYCPLPIPCTNCDAHEVLSECDASCQSTCSQPRPCCTNVLCVSGYVCAENYVRDIITGECVRPAQCTRPA